jgi:hypothetical protein
MRLLKVLILILLISYSLPSFSQFIGDEEPEYAEDETQTEEKKLFFGGNLGLLFGSYTYINLSPSVGYRVHPKLSTGAGIVFEYVNDKTTSYPYETAIYGGKVFAQSVLFDHLILYAEDNFLSLEKKYYDAVNHYPETGRFMVQVPWVGGGIYNKMGNGGVYAMILFNLNRTANSPYPPYEFRIGFNL